MAQPGQNLDTRQKVIVVLTVVFFLIAGWQLVAIFKGNGGGHSHTAATPAPAAATSSVAAPAQQRAPQPNTPAPKQVALPAPSPKTLAELQLSQQNQMEYLQLSSDYQLAKMRQMLADTNASIAKANLSSAKSSLELSKVSQQYKTIHGASSDLSNVTPSQTPSALSHQSTKITISGKYSVALVAYQRGKWTATLRTDDGTLVSVKTGSQLPDDSRVVMINRNGVVLQKDGQNVSLPVPINTATS